MKASKHIPLVLALLIGSMTTAQEGIITEQQKALMEQYMRQADVTLEEDDTPFEPLGMTGSFRMEVSMFKNGKEQENSPITIEYHFDDEHIAMVPAGIKEGKDVQRIVYDLKDKKYTTLMVQGGKKTGVAMRMMKVNMDRVDPVSDPGDLKIQRTGNTKEIDGRRCYEYTGEDKDGKWSAWVDEGRNLRMSKIFRAISSGKKIENWKQMPTEKGLMMESTYASNSGDEKIIMRTRDVVIGTVDESLFSTDGYEVMDMSAFPSIGR